MKLLAPFLLFCLVLGIAFVGIEARSTEKEKPISAIKWKIKPGKGHVEQLSFGNILNKYLALSSMAFGLKIFLQIFISFAFVGLITEASIRVVPISYLIKFYGIDQPQIQYLSYKNKQNLPEAKKINYKMDNSIINLSPKLKDETWDKKENKVIAQQQKLTQNFAPTTQFNDQDYQQKVPSTQKNEQRLPTLWTIRRRRQTSFSQLSTSRLCQAKTSYPCQQIPFLRVSQEKSLLNRLALQQAEEETPSLRHGMCTVTYYTSYDECDPWCRAHCATKRTPEFCFRVGPCLANCYRIVTNF
ncbi:hypothetical protein niasHT_012837 [Heterodera trifolii]|uniref:Uncharacterized protein n=1 Tax=Heterodera trifolii TaxID=157864 RepID=A0ABD2KYN5_9BILA